MSDKPQFPAMQSSLAVLPVMDIATVIQRHKAIIQVIKSEIWAVGVDSGKIPGTDKETLLKPGAEKLCTVFGLWPKFIPITIIEDWDGVNHGGEPFFFYNFNCQLWHGDRLVAEAAGSCNSRESRYRYRWVSEADVPMGTNFAALKKRIGAVVEFAFAIEKAETGGKYGKPAEHWQSFKDAIKAGTAQQVTKPTKDGRQLLAWQIDTTLYRIFNDDIASVVNTIEKISQKRALVATTLLAVNASDLFTQDLEDFDAGTVVEGTARVVNEPVGEGEKRPDEKQAPTKPTGQTAKAPQKGTVPSGGEPEPQEGEPTTEVNTAKPWLINGQHWILMEYPRSRFYAEMKNAGLTDAEMKALLGKSLGRTIEHFHEVEMTREQMTKAIRDQLVKETTPGPKAATPGPKAAAPGPKGVSDIDQGAGK